ncbi:unnamed protein product [Rotaria sp. Silwood2]|nr:unnamed protein product [Rotaria sp. Silwood2]CAF4348341.1 unnamed protein product [Rotaria sp. Silwood2]
MARYLLLIFIIALCNITKKTSIVVNAKFFEYELPNRTVTICPTHSLISIECPQHPSLDNQKWQSNVPQYLISIDYIRSFPSRLGHDPSSCQPDLSHACNNYDLRYINTLCNGKPQCSDIPAYQIRDRSLCAFKAVTNIGFHCVPTWNLREIQTKCDICKNGSLTNDYGFIYSRNYPSDTIRVPCFTTIYARPYHKTVLYFVNGQLNHDQLKIESVSSEGVTLLNATLNGNQTTQRLAVSTYEMKITFIPGMIYSYHSTNYLLYFYTIPVCSYIDPCPTGSPLLTTTSIVIPETTSRMRFQSVGWTKVPNIWIVIPIILAYILLLLVIIVLALLFHRRRKQQKALNSVTTKDLSSRYLETSGTSSRAQLVTPLPPPIGNNTGIDTHRRASTSQSIHYPLSTTSFAQNMERYHRESRSDFDLHHSTMNDIDYGYHASIPSRSRAIMTNGIHRPYGTIDYSSINNNIHRRCSLPKSFSDCNLCKQQVFSEEYQHYYDEEGDNWHLEDSKERQVEPRTYREKIKERFRERLTVRKIPDADILPPPTTTTVEYSTVLPRHQRIGSQSNRSNGQVHHLPFQYIPNENSKNVRTVEYKRNSSQEHVAVGNNQQPTINDENGTTNFTVKFYERDDDDTENQLDRCLHEAREVQEMSMRMSEQQQQQHFNRYQYQHQQQRRCTGNADI